MSSNIYKDIIRQREATPEGQSHAEAPPLPADGEYLAFRSGSRVQMGFALHRANGDMDGFLFHNLDNLALRRAGGAEFLTFTHRGKAVTMQGRGLKAIMQAIMAHTLMELYEHDGKVVAMDAPVIQRVEVTMSDKAAGKGGAEPLLP
jgi:hypothetical protein